MAELQVEQVLDPSFVDGLDERTTGELRGLRRTCEAIESQLSYRRRLLHGHMDLLRAEIDRRDGAGAGVGAATELLSHLSDGVPTGASRSPSHQRFGPGDADHLAGDELAGAVMSADLPDLSDTELRVRAEELVAAEHEVSQMRRTVLDRLDAVQAEIVRRYRDGRASIDELLPPPAAR